MSEERVSRTARTHSCHGPRSLRGTGDWIAAARRQTLNAEKGVQQRTIQCHVAVFAARCTKSFERADRALRAHCPTRAPALVHAIACPQREVTGQKAGAGSRTEEAQESLYCPCTSPTMRVGALSSNSTGCSMRIFFTAAHIFLIFVLRELGLVALAEFEQPLRAVVQLGSTTISAARGGHVNALRRV